jgi:ribosomal protein L10
MECWIVGESAIQSALADLPSYEFVRIDKLNLLAIPEEKRLTSGLKIQKI